MGNALIKVLKRAIDDDELAEWIDSALENLAFTEGVQAFEMLDLADEDFEDEDDDLEDDELENVEDYLESLDDDEIDLDEFDTENEDFEA